METMKKWLVVSLVIILCLAIALTACLLWVRSLSNRLTELELRHQSLSEDARDLYSELYGLQVELEEMDREAKSLLTDLQYTIGDPGADMKTVPVALTVTPKSTTEDMQVFVTFQDTTIPMTRTGNQFSGSVEVGMFADYEEQLVLAIETAAGTQTEILESVDICELFTQYLPRLNVSTSGTSTDGTEAASADFGFTCVTTGFVGGTIVDFRKVSLVRWKDGQEILNQDITERVRIAAPEYITSFSITPGEHVEQELIAEDTLGYIHKIQTTSYFSSDSDEGLMVDYSEEQIYDREGNLLYGVPSPWEA